MRRALPLLILPLALTACQNQAVRNREAHAQNAELARRVTALEAEVHALKTGASPGSSGEAQAVTVQAAAQTCANDLNRALELYRRDSIERRYPTAAELALPDSCGEQRVRWEKLEPHAYTFTLLDAAGRELARQSGGAEEER